MALRADGEAVHSIKCGHASAVRAMFVLLQIGVLYERHYGVRQVEKQRSAEKANHAAQRQIKSLTGGCNLIGSINFLRGLNKAPAADHNNSDTEHDESQAGGIGKCGAMRRDLFLRRDWRGISQE